MSRALRIGKKLSQHFQCDPRKRQISLRTLSGDWLNSIDFNLNRLKKMISLMTQLLLPKVFSQKETHCRQRTWLRPFHFYCGIHYANIKWVSFWMNEWMNRRFRIQWHKSFLNFFLCSTLVLIGWSRCTIANWTEFLPTKWVWAKRFKRFRCWHIWHV